MSELPTGTITFLFSDIEGSTRLAQALDAAWPPLLERHQEIARAVWSAHGGIVAGYLDEVLAGAAVRHNGRIHVTGELTVRYVKPVPLDTPLLGRGRVVQDHGKYLDLEGTLEDYRSRAVLAQARGRFLPIS